MLVSLKVESQWVKFQLLKPIGGVRASPFSSARAGVAATTASPAAMVTNTVSSRDSLRDTAVLRSGVGTDVRSGQRTALRTARRVLVRPDVLGARTGLQVHVLADLRVAADRRVDGRAARGQAPQAARVGGE